MKESSVSKSYRHHSGRSSRSPSREYSRERDRKYRSRRQRSDSPPQHYKKYKKSKKSKKYSRRSSSSSSSRSDSSSNSSSRGSRYSKKSSSRSRKVCLPSSDSNSHSAKSIVTPKLDLLDAQVQKVLTTIEEDVFKPQSFLSTRNRDAPPKASTSEKVIIDLNSDTITIPKAADTIEENLEHEYFHPNFIGEQENKIEKWIKRLYNYRQKFI
ncbi:ADP-ribosylation factor-like protein 6-interacting protein 4 [Teleopsis dalmanni]|uniref:ADP-ribosylation factor-like protein 6-interacting protein 4 n=1 Tax=Teleopsis dalmanni TaxID=139649 RepID=UPI0018CFCB2F|nr:ADP-ribosylation factor-like protein 6-interacting protein 4 [Teleopsis dalmanni]XP_037949573.1 ADP-ribosylation factor-like protein 6-interacting protein 4 [Teleopsis dalmanni]XP_037949574.1 ADP-ribosylation factor-like protein 6-interacting protein 4 [Teleopsis dalmanni]XP_037949575.1 ADP-ribosylation factor-like protein 6-interacting protein 4 [Teleopsis dalmanni]